MPTRTWTIRTTRDLGRTVADIRAARHLTQAELAADSGLTRDYVSKLETGRTSPLLDHLLRILRRLGATITVTIDAPAVHEDTAAPQARPTANDPSGS